MLRSYLRYYQDNWGITSYTASLEVPIKLGDFFTLYPSYRYYTQSRADYFYKANDALSTDAFYTSDYDLSSFNALNPSSKKEDFVKGAYFFEKIYSQDKNNLEALYNLIIVSIRCGVYNYVTHHLIERHKTNNKDQKVIEALSKINFVLGNISESVHYLSKLIKINPNYPLAFEEYIISLNYISDKSQEEYFKQALEFDQLPKINCEPFIKINNKKSKIKFSRSNH